MTCFEQIFSIIHYLLREYLHLSGLVLAQIMDILTGHNVNLLNANYCTEHITYRGVRVGDDLIVSCSFSNDITSTHYILVFRSCYDQHEESYR